MTSQIISLTIVYSTVYSDADQRKQMASNAENVSIDDVIMDYSLRLMCDKLRLPNILILVNILLLVQKQLKAAWTSQNFMPKRLYIYMRLRLAS